MRRAFTLVETLVSMSLLSVVMGACVSITILAARSMPATNDATTARLAARLELERLAAELATAVEITRAESDDLIASVVDPGDGTTVYQVRVTTAGSGPISLVRGTRTEKHELAPDLAGVSIAYAPDTADPTRVASITIVLTPTNPRASTIRQTFPLLVRPRLP